VVSFTLRPLYSQGKSPYYLLDRRLYGSQSQFGTEKLPTLPGIEIRSPTIRIIVTMLTELPQLEELPKEHICK
jgi:hypothetical protein